MNRDEKVAIVSELSESLGRSKLTVVADYCGLKVSEFQKVRVELKAELSGDFTGTTAVVTAYSDPVGPAKAVTRFAEDHDKFVIRSAALDGEKIDFEKLVALSKLPSKEILLGQLLSTWSSVPGGLVQVLAGVPRTFVYALQAVKEQKETGSN